MTGGTVCETAGRIEKTSFISGKTGKRTGKKEAIIKRQNCLVGYSGHESNLEPSVITAILGACLIERHVTLDHNIWGSD